MLVNSQQAFDILYISLVKIRGRLSVQHILTITRKLNKYSYIHSMHTNISHQIKSVWKGSPRQVAVRNRLQNQTKVAVAPATVSSPEGVNQLPLN